MPSEKVSRMHSAHSLREVVLLQVLLDGQICTMHLPMRRTVSDHWWHVRHTLRKKVQVGMLCSKSHLESDLASCSDRERSIREHAGMPRCGPNTACYMLQL